MMLKGSCFVDYLAAGECVVCMNDTLYAVVITWCLCTVGARSHQFGNVQERFHQPCSTILWLLWTHRCPKVQGTKYICINFTSIMWTFVTLLAVKVYCVMQHLLSRPNGLRGNKCIGSKFNRASALEWL